MKHIYTLIFSTSPTDRTPNCSVSSLPGVKFILSCPIARGGEEFLSKVRHFYHRKKPMYLPVHKDTLWAKSNSI